MKNLILVLILICPILAYGSSILTNSTLTCPSTFPYTSFAPEIKGGNGYYDMLYSNSDCNQKPHCNKWSGVGINADTEADAQAISTKIISSGLTPYTNQPVYIESDGAGWNLYYCAYSSPSYQLVNTSPFEAENAHQQIAFLIIDSPKSPSDH